jgi:hypothetical protein
MRYVVYPETLRKGDMINSFVRKILREQSETYREVVWETVANHSAKPAEETHDSRVNYFPRVTAAQSISPYLTNHKQNKPTSQQMPEMVPVVINAFLPCASEKIHVQVFRKQSKLGI